MNTSTASAALRPRDAASQRQGLLEVVRSLHAELRHGEPCSGQVTLDSALDRDLGFDSLARVELVLRIERELGVRLPETTLASVETLADLLGAVTSAAVDAAAAGGAGPAVPVAAFPRAEPGTPTHAATLQEVLHWRVETMPDAIHAVVLGEGPPEPLSYAQLEDGARRVAGALLDAGVEAGSRVALMLPTSGGYLRAFLGVLLAGAIPVPVYPPVRAAQLEEHVHRHAGIFANAAVTTLVTFAEARTVARLLRARVPTLRSVLSITELAEGERRTAPGTPAADAIAMLQYTSGSTGAPKGVVLTHANLLANIRAMGRTVRASGSDVFVSWLPLYHDMGLIGAWLGSLYYGCLFVVMPPTAFLARPARWLRTIHDYRATLSAAPNFGYELCARRIAEEELRGLDLSRWRVAFNGAEPVLPGTLERFAQRFAACGFRAEAMTPVYGLAEAAVGVTFPPLGRGPLTDCVDRGAMMRSGRALPPSGNAAGALRFVSCGRPLPDYQLRVVDAGGSELPERLEGTVQFTGPSATAGYYRNAGATARLLHGQWLDTGDRGYLANGELYVTGRVKDMIIRRGRHIYADDVEQAVAEVEGVRRGCVAAFGATEPATATEKLIVLAETRERDPGRLAQLEARINQRVVASIGEPADEIRLAPPHTVLKTSSGKLRRAAMRAAYEDGSLGRAPPAPAVQLLRLALAGALPALTRLRQAAGRLAYGVRSCLALLVFCATLGLGWLLLRDRARLWRWNHFASRALLRALGIPLVVRWQGEIDLTVPHVVVANHCSYADGIIIGAALPGLHLFVAKRELLDVPVLGAWLRRLGSLFIERFEPEQRVAEVERLQRTLAQGDSLVVFPEGTFTRAAGLRPFHLGAFQAAVAAGSVVVPLALQGTRLVLRDGEHLPRPMPVSIVIGPPLAPAAQGDRFAAAARLCQTARAHILRHCGEPDLA